MTHFLIEISYFWQTIINSINRYILYEWNNYHNRLNNIQMKQKWIGAYFTAVFPNLWVATPSGVAKRFLGVAWWFFAWFFLFDSLNSINLQGPGFTVIDHTGKIAAYSKKAYFMEKICSKG